VSGAALVTGAGRGIGAAIAARLAADGRPVAIAARNVDELAVVAETTGALPIPLDVTDADAVASAVARVERELGPVELLVSNAGLAGTGGPTWQKEPSAWWRVVEVNLLGTFLCARAVLPGMCERGAGRIVNVSSNSAFFPLGGDDWGGRIDSAYQASKAAVIRLTEALAAEARPYGVSAFVISPGMVKTAMTEPIFDDVWDDPELWTPAERTAALVSFLGSGALDRLSGRYIHAARDDWEAMPGRIDELLAGDLNTLRLRTS